MQARSQLSHERLLERINYFLSTKLYVFFTLTLLGFAVYWPVLGSDFIGDDIDRIILSERLISVSLSDILMYYKTDRPLMMLTIWMNYQMSALNPAIYKLTNLLLHLVCACSAFNLLARLFQHVRFNFIISFLATAIFLVHPLNHLVVQVAIQRGVSMAGIFTIWSFLLFLNYEKDKSKFSYLASIAFFLLAVISKPNSIVLPIVFFAYLIYLKNNSIKNVLSKTAPYFLFWLIPLWQYFVVGAVQADIKFGAWEYFLIQTKVFFIYIYKFFWPSPMEYFHALHNSATETLSANYWPYFVAYILTLTVLAYWFYKKRNLISMLLFVAYILYLPQSSFYSIVHVLFYHRLYLSVLFVAAALAVFLFKDSIVSKYKYTGVLLLTMLLGYSSVLTLNYNVQTSSYNGWLWYNIQANPNNLHFNNRTLFSLRDRKEPREQIQKFADFIVAQNPTETELKYAKSIALYDGYKLEEQRKVVIDIVSFLSSQNISSSFFQGALPFLELELPRFFSVEKSVLALNSVYFTHLNSFSTLMKGVYIRQLVLQNFESVYKLPAEPQSLTLEDRERVEFFRLRSRIVLASFFNQNTGLDLMESLQIINSRYQSYPESKWLIEQIQKLQLNNEKK